MTTLTTFAGAAVVLGGRDAGAYAERVCRILALFGIPHHTWSAADAAAGLAPAIEGSVVLAPLGAFAAALRRTAEGNGQLPAPWRGAAAIHVHGTGLPDALSADLRVVTGVPGCRAVPLAAGEVPLSITGARPELTGPMSGLGVRPRVAAGQYACMVPRAAGVEAIFETRAGTTFFAVSRHGIPTLVSLGPDIPDVNAVIAGQWFDVREHFHAAVPLVMALKWALGAAGWQSSESGASLIVDDPPLKRRYGYLDFARLDRLMREHRFATNIAFIPWNARRTSRATAALVGASGGRFSVSTHGCDHTDAEFGTDSAAVLDAKVRTIRQRMERHAARTGIPYDAIMVFPQGVFSAASFRALQRSQFLAAVNSETVSVDVAGLRPRLADLWSVAALTYASFPLFTRRYPDQGVENFAFDLLLGKPCLIGQHHVFFRDGGTRAVAFIEALNALNADLRWQPLGTLLRRAYQWRPGAGLVHVRMFANELELTNASGEERVYAVEKPDRDSVGVEAILTDRGPAAWEREADRVVATVRLRPGEAAAIRVRYTPPPEPGAYRSSALETVKVAVRRYASEFRDNVLSRYEPLERLGAVARNIIRSR